MANGISRRSVHEALEGAIDRDGTLDLWALAHTIADDVENWGEDDFFSEQSSNADEGEPPPPRYWLCLQKDAFK
jgi:hypothetical protein